MNIENLRDYCLSLGPVTEDFPFDEETIVFRVGGKIFLLTNINSMDLKFNIKCDPELAIQLREEFPFGVLPGFHMNKKHWNTIISDQVSDKSSKEWIQHSFDLVYKSLNKKERENLKL